MNDFVCFVYGKRLRTLTGTVFAKNRKRNEMKLNYPILHRKSNQLKWKSNSNRSEFCWKHFDLLKHWTSSERFYHSQCSQLAISRIYFVSAIKIKKKLLFIHWIACIERVESIETDKKKINFFDNIIISDAQFPHRHKKYISINTKK